MTWFGLDEKSCLALARAYERSGRLADAEGLRARLQRRFADSLGLQRTSGGDAGGEEGELPSVGGRVRMGRRRYSDKGEGDGGEEKERDEQLEAGERAYRHAVGGSDEYGLFLEWMAAGEGEEAGGEGVRGGEGLWADESEGGGAGAVPGAPAGEGWDVTVRELEGW